MHKVLENPDHIERRLSLTIRRASKVKNLKLGLAEKYEISASKYETSLRSHGLHAKLHSENAEADESYPRHGPSVVSKSSSGYTDITSVGILTRDPVPIKRVDRELLSNTLTEALGLGSQDFNHIVLKRRPPACGKSTVLTA